MITKSEVRKVVRGRVAGAPVEDRAAWSRSLCARLWERVDAAGMVMGFVPLPGEPDIGDVLERLAAAGRLCLPRVDWTARRMSAARVERLSDLVEGKFGVKEPPVGGAGTEEVPLAELGAVLVPGLAFDARGNRLGRGAGFYDRFLAELRRSPGESSAGSARAIGVAFELQIVQDVPTDPWDQRLDAIATESRWMDVAP